MTGVGKKRVARLDDALAALPIVAVLRGLKQDEALAVVAALYEAGIRVVEVPLNSPDAFASIALLKDHYGDRMVIGAGTVTTIAQVAQLHRSGADIVVSPTTDFGVIAAAVAAGMVPIPGYSTPTEAFAAVAAGARHLNFFPAEGRAKEIAALGAVLPAGIKIIAVGGVGAATMSALQAADCQALGISSDIFQSGISPAEVSQSARKIIAAVRAPKVKTPRLACNPAAIVGESPIWCARTESVTWVDPVGQRLLVHTVGRSDFSVCDLSVTVFGIAAADSNRLVGTLDAGFCAIDRTSGKVTSGCLAEVGKGCRLNDLTIDAQGGLWAGSMHRGLVAGRGAIFHAPTLDGTCRRVAEGLGVANGMAFGTDGKLYVVDTLSRNLIAYPADIDAGFLGEPVIVADFLGVPGKPDGLIALDDGTFWVAMWGGGRIVRIGANGAVIDHILVPAPNISSMCVGDLGALWITTSRLRLSQQELMNNAGSGGLYEIEHRP